MDLLLSYLKYTNIYRHFLSYDALFYCASQIMNFLDKAHNEINLYCIIYLCDIYIFWVPSELSVLIYTSGLNHNCVTIETLTSDFYSGSFKLKL